MVAGTAGVDYPTESAALSVLPLGQDQALTSRARRASESHLYITVPRDGTGGPTVLVGGDLVELSWQADDGLRSVPAEVVTLTDDSLWKVAIKGAASRIQRREAVRAPIGLSVSVAWGRIELTGSTSDLSEGGLLCVFRPHGDLGVHVPYPKKGQRMALTLDLYSDTLCTDVELVRRRPREDQLHEWSLRFVDLPESASDVIRSHVFTALRNARSRGISALY
jgi:hypothetical protein